MTDPIGMASLFGDPPAGPSQDVKFRQGIIQTFNPVTLQNTVLVGGSILTDLPLLGVAEATTLVPGANVGIMVIGSEDRAKTMFIIGRSVIPNTAEATSAITLLGQSISTGFVGTTESTTSVPFTDLATPGPFAELRVGASGKILIILGATIAVGPAAGAVWGGFVNFTAVGANTIAAGTPGGLGYSSSGINPGGGPNMEFSIARIIPLNGLNPGITTFQCKYSILFGAPGETASFRNRSIAVFAM